MLAGTLLASRLQTGVLFQIFGIYTLIVALQMGSGWRVGVHERLPKIEGLSLAGVIIGIISSLVGIGGGSMSVPYLMWHSAAIRQAVATAAANGLSIATAGAAGYIVSGMSAQGWQGLQMGYVHLGVLAALVVGSMLFAPLGARVAHTVNPATLKRGFALLMAASGSKCCSSEYRPMTHQWLYKGFLC